MAHPWELNPENRPATFEARVAFRGIAFGSRLLVTVNVEMGNLYCGDTERVIEDIADQVAEYVGKDQRLESYEFEGMWVKPWTSGEWQSVAAAPPRRFKR